MNSTENRRPTAATPTSRARRVQLPVVGRPPRDLRGRGGPQTQGAAGLVLLDRGRADRRSGHRAHAVPPGGRGRAASFQRPDPRPSSSYGDESPPPAPGEPGADAARVAAAGRALVVPVLLALLSALAAAVYLVLQRDSNRAAPTGLPAWRLTLHLLRDPVWLLGQGSWLVAFGLQALALHLGRLSVVQPVLVTELVYTLLIRRFVSRWPVRTAAWGSAAPLCGSRRPVLGGAA